MVHDALKRSPTQFIDGEPGCGHLLFGERAAIHAAYWAAIVRMEETKSLPEDRSRTPRESLRLIQKESADYPPLVRLTERFELVWYGYRSATDADWSDAMQQLETLGCLRSSTAAISGS